MQTIDRYFRLFMIVKRFATIKKRWQIRRFTHRIITFLDGRITEDDYS